MITTKKYIETNKLDLMREINEVKEKLASVCIPLGIDGQTAKALSPDALNLLAAQKIQAIEWPKSI